MLFFLRGHPWCDDCCIFSTRSLPQYNLCLAIPLLRISWGLTSFDSIVPLSLELLTFSVEPIVTVQGVGVNSLSIRCAWVPPAPPPVPNIDVSPTFTFKISFFFFESETPDDMDTFAVVQVLANSSQIDTPCFGGPSAPPGGGGPISYILPHHASFFHFYYNKTISCGLA
jgi:hypothetical protein